MIVEGIVRDPIIDHGLTSIIEAWKHQREACVSGVVVIRRRNPIEAWQNREISVSTMVNGVIGKDPIIGEAWKKREASGSGINSEATIIHGCFTSISEARKKSEASVSSSSTSNSEATISDYFTSIVVVSVVVGVVKEHDW